MNTYAELGDRDLAAGNGLNARRGRAHLTMVYMAALLLLFLIHCNCRADESRRDGYWWSAQSEVNQVGYITGFFDGLILEQRIFDATLYNATPPKASQQLVDFATNVEFEANTQMDRLFTRVTVPQIRDGLKKFYSDPRNRRVLLFNATFVVVNAIAGSPREHVEGLAETYRVSDIK